MIHIIDLFVYPGGLFTIICLLYCSWYFIRQGGIKNILIGVLGFFIIGMIPVVPIMIAAYLVTKDNPKNQTADVVEPT